LESPRSVKRLCPVAGKPAAGKLLRVPGLLTEAVEDVVVPKQRNRPVEEVIAPTKRKE